MQFIIGLIGLFVIVSQFTGCDDEKVSEPSRPQLTVEEERALQERIEQARNEREIRERELAESLASASDETLLELLSECRELVRQHAAEDSTGPFPHFLVDEYSADIYQLMAMGGADSLEERIVSYRSLLEVLKESRFPPGLNTTFTAIMTKDGFGGPEKNAVNYHCELEPGPRIAQLTRSNSRY